MKKLVLLSAALMVAFTVSSQNGRRSADHKVQGEVVSTRSSRGSEVKKEHNDNRNGDKFYKKDSNSKYTKGSKPVVIKENTRHPKYHANISDVDRFYSAKHHNSHKHYKKHQDIHYIDNRHHHSAVAVRVNVIPQHHHRFVFNGITLYYTAGAFYKYHHNCYELVTPPVGAVVYELPYDADRVSIDGRIYYEYYDTIYKKVETNRGYAYEVVGQLDWN